MSIHCVISLLWCVLTGTSSFIFSSLTSTWVLSLLKCLHTQCKPHRSSRSLQVRYRRHSRPHCCRPRCSHFSRDSNFQTTYEQCPVFGCFTNTLEWQGGVSIRCSLPCLKWCYKWMSRSSSTSAVLRRISAGSLSNGKDWVWICLRTLATI